MEMKKDIQQKLPKFAHILGILYNPFKPTRVQKYSRIKVYNALVLSVLLYGSKIWILRHRDKINEQNQWR